MRTQQAILASIIHAIGERDFAAVAAGAVRDFTRFDLSAVVVHGRQARPELVFDNFDAVGARQGLQTYVAVTHQVNPMLAHVSRRSGVVRARDFGNRRPPVVRDVSPYLVRSADEELGYRTVGWPEKLEEIGLYFQACGGLVELSLFRERSHHAATAGTLHMLEALREPIAAAFDKHASLARNGQTSGQAASKPFASLLTPREAEVTELLLLGCGSEAIALRLAISRYTVKDHRKQIFRKLGISSLGELFALHRQPAHIA
jgi:DNA-binding CsgD family transcriptional regulator